MAIDDRQCSEAVALDDPDDGWATCSDAGCPVHGDDDIEIEPDGYDEPDLWADADYARDASK